MAKERKVPGGKGAIAWAPEVCRWKGSVAGLIGDAPTRAGLPTFVCPGCGRAVKAANPHRPELGLAEHGVGSRQERLLAEVAYRRQ